MTKRRIARPGAALAGGLAVVAGTALLPAGLSGRPVPFASWSAWIVVALSATGILTVVGGGLGRTLRTVAWILPPVVLLTLPLAAFATAGRGRTVAAALVLRAFAAATAGVATVAALGPSGIVAGLRSLGLPARLCEIVHAMLVSLAAVVRQVSSMLRARAARRTGPAPWSALALAPVETARGFGRLVGALLLRSFERAEALERARRARGGHET